MRRAGGCRPACPVLGWRWGRRGLGAPDGLREGRSQGPVAWFLSLGCCPGDFQCPLCPRGAALHKHSAPQLPGACGFSLQLHESPHSTDDSTPRHREVKWPTQERGGPRTVGGCGGGVRGSGRGLRVAPVPCAVLALPRGTSPAGPASSHREVSGDSPRERAPGAQPRMFARPPWPRPASPGERGQAGWRPGGGRLASWALETGWAGFALFEHGHLFQA